MYILHAFNQKDNLEQWQHAEGYPAVSLLTRTVQSQQVFGESFQEQFRGRLETYDVVF